MTLNLQKESKTSIRKKVFQIQKDVQHAERQKRMRGITFNKKVDTSICLFCKKNPVPVAKWNMRCEECKKKWLKEKKSEGEFGLVSREPAAIIQPDGTDTEIVVDKFGREIPGVKYDKKNDDHAWIKNGQKKVTKTAIL